MAALPVGGVPDGHHFLHDELACSGLSPAAPACQLLLHYSPAWSLHQVHTAPHCSSQAGLASAVSRKDKTRKSYTFWHQFDEKPSIIPGCPGVLSVPDQPLVCILHDQHDMSRCGVFSLALASLQQSVRLPREGQVTAHTNTQNS